MLKSSAIGALICLLLTTGFNALAQQADTLEAARSLSVRSIPASRATEEARPGEAVSPPSTAADAIRRFTGVQVKDYGGAGGLKTVNVRSLGSEHTGVFIDGVQIDNAQNMQVDLGRLSIGETALVSLYNATKSQRLQTAKEYACGASVHLDSEAPVRTAGSVSFRGGSFCTLNPSVQADLALGRVSVRGAAEYLYSDGRYKFPFFGTTLVRENGDIRSMRLESQIFGRLDSGEWRLRLYGYNSERGFPGPVIRRAAGFPLSAERQADCDAFVQGSWIQNWAPRYSTALRFKYAFDYTHYNTHPEKNPMALPYNLHYRQNSGYVSLAQSLSIAEKWSADLSTDLQYNALDSDVGQFVTPRRTTVIAALALRGGWRRLSLSSSLAWECAIDDFKTPDAGGWSVEKDRRSAWMPSLSLLYIPGSGAFELDAFIKRSYRLPSFNDLYYTLTGNSRLSPESAFQAGAGARLRGGAGCWGWELRLAPYYNIVSNKIVAIPTSSQFRWTMLNIGRADIAGLDAKASGTVRKGAFEAEATLRYSLQSALDHSTPGSLTWGCQIPYIPLHSGSIDLVAKLKDWAFAWNTVVCGEKWSRSANTDDYRIAPWSVSDASFSRSLRLKGKGGSFKISLSLNNLFNFRYELVQGYPMPGFNAMASVEYRW